MSTAPSATAVSEDESDGNKWYNSLSLSYFTFGAQLKKSKHFQCHMKILKGNVRSATKLFLVGFLLRLIGLIILKR